MSNKKNTSKKDKIDTEQQVPVEEQPLEEIPTTEETVEETAEVVTPVVEESPEEDEALQKRYLRLQADFDNFRKRVQRERSEVFQRASETIIEEMLPVLDHFEMGLSTAQQHGADETITSGLAQVLEQMKSALKKYGLESFDARGLEFDPHMHEALTQMPSAEIPVDHVVDQLRPGYKLGAKLLRPAQVVVSSGPAEEA